MPPAASTTAGTSRRPTRPGPRARRPLLLAIAGSSGSGKSWLAARLARALGSEAQVLSLDRFYRDRSKLAPAARRRVNFDSPRAIDWPLFLRCLQRLQSGRSAELPIYDFATHTRRAETERFHPGRIVLVEGLWPWQPRRLRHAYAARIYRHTPDPLCLARRTTRDVRERGRTATFARTQWRTHTQPMARRYVLPQRLTADVELGAAPTPGELRQLVNWIHRLCPTPTAPTPPRRRAL